MLAAGQLNTRDSGYYGSSVSDAPAMFVTADGRTVTNRLSTHVSDLVKQYLPKAIAKVDTRGRAFLGDVVDLPFRVGSTSVVDVTEGVDNIVYVPTRVDRRNNIYEGWKRCVIGRRGVSTNQITVVLKRKEEDQEREALKLTSAFPEPVGYVLITAWIGPPTADEPDDIKKRQLNELTRSGGVPLDEWRELAIKRRARYYWLRHARLYEHMHIPTCVQPTRVPPIEWAELLA